MIRFTLAQPVKFGSQFDQHLLAMVALAFGFLGIEAQHVAAAALALADHDFLDFEIVCDRPVTARTGQHLVFDLLYLRIGTARM